MAELNLYQKLISITEEIGVIEKTGRNNQQGYAFMEQAQIVAELRPLLKKYGVAIMPETLSRTVDRYEVTRSNGKHGVDVHASVQMRFTIINADKPEEQFVCAWDGGEAIDSGDKATNKAITASNKYFLIKLFNISDKDDADASSPQAETASPPKKLTPKPQTGYDSAISEAQGKLLLARARDFSGLTDWEEIRSWAEEQIGSSIHEIRKSEMEAALASLEEARV